MEVTQIRIYRRDEVVCFRKTNEDFGGLSNMAPGYPIKILDRTARTSEALYQACRFPHMPDVQRMILDESSPMTAKMRSKPHRKDTRPDWERVRVPIMRWCLRAKLIANWSTFSRLLLSTNSRPIVEDSSKDDYWGAKPSADNLLQGQNVLGRLLMELREQIRTHQEQFWELRPLSIERFTLLGIPIPPISRSDELTHKPTSSGHSNREKLSRRAMP